MHLDRPVRQSSFFFYVTVLISVAATFAASRVKAQEFPLEYRGRTPAQVIDLTEKAAGQKLIIDEMNARVVRSRILFDLTFRENTEQAAWMVMVNLEASRLRTVSREYEAAGYKRSIDLSITANRRRYHTIMWARDTHATVALQIPEGPVPTSGDAFEPLKPIDDSMLSFLKHHNVAGATLAIGKEGQLVYSQAYGYSDVEQEVPMQPDTEMRIASISKSFTSTAILLLVQDGELSLDAPVLPILKKNSRLQLESIPDKRWHDITIRQLLQHTGGFDSDASGDSMFQVSELTQSLNLRRCARQRDIIEYRVTKPLDFNPGDKYEYSNFGYCLLGRVIETISGQPYEEFVKQRFLQPCEMKRTRLGKTKWKDRGDHEARYHMQLTTRHTPFWSVLPKSARRGDPKLLEEVDAPYGRWDLEVMDSHGGWVSTAPDLIRLTSSLDGEPGQLLSEDILQQLVAPPKYNRGDYPGFRYGLGWMARATTRNTKQTLAGYDIWHNGALAGTSALLVRRWDGLTWAVLFNTGVSKNGERLSVAIDPVLHGVLREFSFDAKTDL